MSMQTRALWRSLLKLVAVDVSVSVVDVLTHVM
jgi:hypothetical protein